MLTVMVVMLPSVGASLDRSKLRATSTLLGVIVGGILALLFKDTLWVTIIISLSVLFFACYLIMTNYLYGVFFLSALIILVLSYIEHNIWTFCFWRFIDTLIGIAIAFVVSLLVFPAGRRKIFTKPYIPLLLS